MASEVKLQSPRRQLLAGLPVKERRLPLAGISTAVLEAGKGRPVVLLHGPMAYAAHWMGVIPGLAHDHSVIVPDLPGHGASQTGDVTLDVPRVLAWLDALIGCTCPQPPVMVGQLLGGAIALRFAIEQGERLERLVLVDTFGLAPFQPAPEFGQALMQFQAQPNERMNDHSSCATAPMTSTPCAAAWARSGCRSRPITLSAPARRACGPLCTP